MAFIGYIHSNLKIMTFEEFKNKALNPKECDAPGVYRVRLYNYYTESEYPITELEEGFEFYFPTFEEAKQNIRSYSYGKHSKPYCGFITFHKYGGNASMQSFNKLWLFDTEGNLLDESLSPGTVECHYIPFRGRPQDKIRFSPGDIVEVIDLYTNTASLSIVIRQPISIEQAWAINLKKYKSEGVEVISLPYEEKIAILMTEDDHYKVIHISDDKNDYLNMHPHPTLIMPLHTPVPDDLKKLLKIKMEEYQINNKNENN